MRTYVVARATDERVVPRRTARREKKKGGREGERGIERESGRERRLALLHAELLNSALWLTSSAYSGTYARLNPARVLLSRKVDYHLSRLKKEDGPLRATFRVSGYKLFLGFRERGGGGEKSFR